jgi:hypothetical protein
MVGASSNPEREAALDWHEGLDHSMRYLDIDAIGDVTGCKPKTVQKYADRNEDPPDKIERQFEVLGDMITRQEQAGLGNHEIRAFWAGEWRSGTGDTPGDLLRGERFETLEAQVTQQSQGARQS